MREAEPDTDARIARLENAVGNLKRDTNQLLWIVIGCVVVAAICVVAAKVAEGRQESSDDRVPPVVAYPSPVPDDASEQQLLAGGQHCYGGPEEFAVARERALAAIERFKWAVENMPPPEPRSYGWDLVPKLNPVHDRPNCFEIDQPIELP
ncbi:hypothetical protein BKN37_14470 [Mycobacterium talmoniae]|uniref:Uncharacterized protein n=1 Tax=Mycobacterium talmoniae TaxID=1858794 RepID=A0A1S1NK17_9MYCO|nr:hypothetical protein BKN37_14470 [Mycobacterium talmoniae]